MAFYVQPRAFLSLFPPIHSCQQLCVPLFALRQGDFLFDFSSFLLYHIFDICQKKEKRSKKEKRVQEITGKKLTKKYMKNILKKLVEISGGSTNGEKEKHTEMCVFS